MKRKVQRWQVDDFRASRRLLDPEIFLDGSNPPPTDLIDEDIWNSIMYLPDHVSITTSNHHGSLLKVVHNIAAKWVEAVSFTEDQLYYPMIDAGYEFDIAIFNALHGWYRPAIGALRNALELITIAAYTEILNKTTEFAEWRAGMNEITFGVACNKLASDRTLLPFNSYLKAKANDSLFAQKSQSVEGGWARRLYANLSDYSHSRPTFTDVDMWQSNGPIYVTNAFLHAAKFHMETSALCFLIVNLARPRFVLPKEVSQLVNKSRKPWARIARIAFSYLLVEQSKSKERFG